HLRSNGRHCSNDPGLTHVSELMQRQSLERIQVSAVAQTRLAGCQDCAASIHYRSTRYPTVGPERLRCQFLEKEVIHAVESAAHDDRHVGLQILDSHQCTRLGMFYTTDGRQEHFEELYLVSCPAPIESPHLMWSVTGTT